MLLKTCLNGARRPKDHPALPVTPAALAADVLRVVAAGAGAVQVLPDFGSVNWHESGDGSAAPDNAALVTAARALLRRLGA